MVQLVKNLPAMQDTWVQSLDWEDPLEKRTYTQSSKYSGLENSIDCIDHGVAKSQTRLSDFHFHCASQVVLVVKNLSARAGDTGSIPA